MSDNTLFKTTPEKRSRSEVTTKISKFSNFPNLPETPIKTKTMKRYVISSGNKLNLISSPFSSDSNFYSSPQSPQSPQSHSNENKSLSNYVAEKNPINLSIGSCPETPKKKPRKCEIETDNGDHANVVTNNGDHGKFDGGLFNNLILSIYNRICVCSVEERIHKCCSCGAHEDFSDHIVLMISLFVRKMSGDKSTITIYSDANFDYISSGIMRFSNTLFDDKMYDENTQNLFSLMVKSYLNVFAYLNDGLDSFNYEIVQ